MEEIGGFSMQDCLSVPGLGLKNFNSPKSEEDERKYTYNDKYMKHFIRQLLMKDVFVLSINIINQKLRVIY